MATDIRQVLLSTLRLLGMETSALERSLHIPFNVDMFNLPNKKGFEAVMHFLFNKLDPAKCKEEFRNCWPVTDKKDEAQFRKVCNNWLSQIAEDDPEAHLPRVVPSLFMSPGGDRFIQLLFAFASYVMLKTIQGEFGVAQRAFLRHPVLSSQSEGLTSVMAEGLMCGTARHRKAFLRHTYQASSVQDHWKEHARDIVKVHRSLTKVCRELEKEIKEEIQATGAMGSTVDSPVSNRRKSGPTDYDHSVQSVRRAAKVQQVRDHWRQLEKFSVQQKKAVEVIESVLDGSTEKHCINAHKLDIKVPDLLLRQCEHEISRRNVSNLYHGGKLNLLSLIHLGNLSLHLYIEKLHEAGVPDFEVLQPVISSQVKTYQAHVANMQALRSELENHTLPKLRNSISRLKRKLDASVLNCQSPGSLRTTSVGLGLIPPSPPYVFDPLDTPTQNSHSFPLSSKMAACVESHPSVPTPEAAAQLMQDIQRKAVQATAVPTPLVPQGKPIFGPRLPQDPAPSVPNGASSKLPQPAGKKRPQATSKSSRQPSLKADGRRQSSRQASAPHPEVKVKVTRHADPKAPKKESEFKVPAPKRGKPKQLAPRVEKHSSSSPERDLADEIADQVMGSGAFAPRDRLARTPGPARTWELRLDSSEGPLSSTRIENGDADDKQPKQVQQPFSSTDEDRSSSSASIRQHLSHHLSLHDTLNTTATHEWLAHDSRESSPLSPAFTTTPSSIHSASSQPQRPDDLLARVIDFDDVSSQTSAEEVVKPELDRAQELMEKAIDGFKKDILDLSAGIEALSAPDDNPAPKKLHWKDFHSSSSSEDQEEVPSGIDPPAQFQDEDFKRFATLTQTPKKLLERLQSEEALSAGSDNDLVNSGCLTTGHHESQGSCSSEEEETVRVIQFQNGSFNEFLEKSPERSSLRQSHESLVRSSHIEEGFKLTQSLEAELEAWRQKGLVPPRDGTTASKSPSSPEQMNSDIQQLRNRLDQIKSRIHLKDTNHSYASPLQSAASTLKASNLQEELEDLDFEQGLVGGSPLEESASRRTPAKHISLLADDENSLGSTEFNLSPHAIITSPMTELLHTSGIEDNLSPRFSLGPGILESDDASFLLPSSPVQLESNSPEVGNLIDL